MRRALDRENRRRIRQEELRSRSDAHRRMFPDARARADANAARIQAAHQAVLREERRQAARDLPGRRAAAAAAAAAARAAEPMCPHCGERPCATYDRRERLDRFRLSHLPLGAGARHGDPDDVAATRNLYARAVLYEQYNRMEHGVQPFGWIAPAVPQCVTTMIRGMCPDPQDNHVGYATWRAKQEAFFASCHPNAFNDW